MATTTVASLLVSLGLDSVEFVRDSKRAETAVQTMAKGINASARDVVKASSSMGVSIRQFAGEVSALRARLDPASTAVAAYRKEMDLLRNAYRIGSISQEQFLTGTRQALTAYRATGGGVAQASGQMRAGMQQLSFQINDVATQFASGTRPMQIFAQQSSQVVQAIQMMSTGSNKFTRFLLGPWGMAITAATVVLSALIGKMLEAKKATADLELASSGLSDAQSVLGQMFDLTTGKIKHNTEAVRENIAAMALQLRAKAADKRANAESTLGNFRSGSLGLGTGEKILGALGVPVHGATGREMAVRRVAQGFVGGQITGAAAIKMAEGLDFSGLAINQKDFVQAILDRSSAPALDKTADAIDKSLRDGSLDPSLREPGHSRKTREKKDTGPSAADIERRYTSQLDQIRTQQLSLEADYTGSLKQKRDAAIAEVNADLAAFERDTKADENLSAAQKASLIEAQQGLAAQKRKNIEQEHGRDLANKAADIANSELNVALENARIQSDLADNSRDKLAAERKILDITDRIRIAELDRVIAVEAAGSAAYENAYNEQQALIASRGDRAKLVDRQNATPGMQFRDSLKLTVGQMNDAIEGIKIRGLDDLNDALASAIFNTKNLGATFKSVAAGILADLLRIELRKSIIAPLAKLLNLGGSLSSKGSQSFDAAFADFPLPKFARGTNYAPGGLALVGEQGPELVNLGRGSQVIPNHELKGMGGGNIAQIVPSKWFDVRVIENINAASPRIAAAGGEMGFAKVARAGRRSLGR